MNLAPIFDAPKLSITGEIRHGGGSANYDAALNLNQITRFTGRLQVRKWSSVPQPIAGTFVAISEDDGQIVHQGAMILPSKISAGALQGPFADDPAAAAAGVLVGELYHRTGGLICVRAA